MVQRGCGPRFDLETPRPVGIRSEVARQDRDRDFPAEARVARAVDFSQYAGADARGQLVGSQPVPDRGKLDG